jgi:hypothetical protein
MKRIHYLQKFAFAFACAFSYKLHHLKQSFLTSKQHLFPRYFGKLIPITRQMAQNWGQKLG